MFGSSRGGLGAGPGTGSGSGSDGSRHGSTGGPMPEVGPGTLGGPGCDTATGLRAGDASECASSCINRLEEDLCSVLDIVASVRARSEMTAVRMARQRRQTVAALRAFLSTMSVQQSWADPWSPLPESAAGKRGMAKRQIAGRSVAHVGVECPQGVSAEEKRSVAGFFAARLGT